MKTKKLSKKMGLNKKTIANLNHESMKKSVGGDCGDICPCKVFTCRTCLQGTCTCSCVETLTGCIPTTDKITVQIP